MVEAIVWHPTLEMRHIKYLMYYQMKFYAFDVLVEELTPFFKFECLHLVMPQLEVKEIVAIVLYMFAHGLSPKHMSNIFDMGAPTACKYVDIMCDVFCNKDKLFDKYIKISIKDHLLHIIQQFEDLTCLPNICGAIDGTHILLVERPNKRYTIAIVDYYNIKGFHNIVLQTICDTQKLFQNVCASQPRGVHDGGLFKTFSLYHDLQT
jgi:hypothetical protein